MIIGIDVAVCISIVVLFMLFCYNWYLLLF